MRTGKNPAKESIELESKYYHRIIVPVYIPNFEGYFTDAKRILGLCLDSIVNTIHEKTCITLVNNGCCDEIRLLLNEYFEKGKVEQVVHFQENKGKIDALSSVAKGCYEPLITITDSDVLFLPGWITEVEKAIQAFPQIGLISPCPLPALWNYKNTATLLGAFFSFNLKYKELVGETDLLKFQESVNNPKLYEGKEALLKKQLYMSRNGTSVIIGAGHFVATLRREVFKAAPDKPSLRKIIGNSERRYIDIPVDKLGLYRVGTSGIYAHHMGNTLEPWMTQVFEKHTAAARPSPISYVPKLRRSASAIIPYVVRKYLSLMLVSRILRKIFFTFSAVGSRIEFKS